jgi:hypothetical protein
VEYWVFVNNFKKIKPIKLYSPKISMECPNPKEVHGFEELQKRKENGGKKTLRFMNKILRPCRVM